MATADQLAGACNFFSFDRRALAMASRRKGATEATLIIARRAAKNENGKKAPIKTSFGAGLAFLAPLDSDQMLPW
jgi:hypothetical protein